MKRFLIPIFFVCALLFSEAAFAQSGAPRRVPGLAPPPPSSSIRFDMRNIIWHLGLRVGWSTTSSSGTMGFYTGLGFTTDIRRGYYSLSYIFGYEYPIYTHRPKPYQTHFYLELQGVAGHLDYLAMGGASVGFIFGLGEKGAFVRPKLSLFGGTAIYADLRLLWTDKWKLDFNPGLGLGIPYPIFGALNF